jgi:cytochrome c oxidase subunit I+III
MILAWQGFHVVVLAVMALYTLARSLAGRLDAVRRVTFDNTMLLWHYAVAQGIVGLALTYGFPLAVGPGAG